MRVLLITPPMVQLNTPYAATPQLTAWLRAQGVDAIQFDASIELALRLFNGAFLSKVSEHLRRARRSHAPSSPAVERFIEEAEAYISTIEPAVAFLQGRAPELAPLIAMRRFLPEGPRFNAIGEMARSLGGCDPLEMQFGTLGTSDKAKYLASLYLDDVADVLRDGLDSKFGLSRYAEKLAACGQSFDGLDAALCAPGSLIDGQIDELGRELVARLRPELVGFTVPFPGNLYGALRMSRAMKRASPGLLTVIGGGYVSTELRELEEPRVFDHVDFVVLDAGERPLALLIEHVRGGGVGDALCRTFVRRDGRVSLVDGCGAGAVSRADIPAPTFDGLRLDRYVSLMEMPNPMHRLWSDGRWNKMMLAHGCYWRKCAFCDVSLDYIKRFDAGDARGLVDRLETVIGETGCRGFHFVDEAAPPALLGQMADEILRRRLAVSWWTNIRFEKAFTASLADKLAAAGCVAVSGGLETANDRLLALMGKGVTIEQGAAATRAFAGAGILVHAYLIYGFPTETVRETVEALEIVRQLFAAGCIQSAFWHRFALTVHSPIAAAPARYGIRLAAPVGPTFARNELAFVDPVGADHAMLGEGLRAATYNYMHGIGLEFDVREWFPDPVSKPQVARRFIEKILRA